MMGMINALQEQFHHLTEAHALTKQIDRQMQVCALVDSAVDEPRDRVECVKTAELLERYARHVTAAKVPSGFGIMTAQQALSIAAAYRAMAKEA